jgi:hypothetical protein
VNAIQFRRGTLVAALAIVGCSNADDRWTKDLPRTVPASGVVLLDGAPLEGATVAIMQLESEENYSAKGLTDSEGYVELNAYTAKPGAVPGSYQVMIVKTVEVNAEVPSPAELGVDAGHAAESPDANLSWKNVLPARYADPVTSGLTAEIPEEGTSELRFELKSNP